MSSSLPPAEPCAVPDVTLNEEMIPERGPAARLAEVVPLPNLRSDAEVLAGLERGQLWAQRQLFERYGALVERMVRHMLGPGRHNEIADVVHDAFVAVFASVRTLKDPAALPSWIRSVAANTSLNCIRRRRARSWLRFFAPEELPEPVLRPADDAREAHDRTYRLLESLPAQERLAFVLRFIEGMELLEVADACGVSLSTAKRRIARAERLFCSAATEDPVLSHWLQKGDRWTS